MIKKIISSCIFSALTLANFTINAGGTDIYKEWFEAARNGNIDDIQGLKSKVNINAQNDIGDTALKIASARGHEDIVKLLLRVPGININAQDIDGETALMRAVFWSNKTMVTLLLNAGADPNIKNNEGKTALDQAREKFKPILEALINETKIPISLAPVVSLDQWFTAAKQGDLDVIQKLIDKVDVNVQDHDGDSALILAANNGHENIVKLLLQSPNINVNMRDKLGFTALMPASRDGNPNIVKLLLAKPEIDVNMQSNAGTTALWVASAWGRENVVKLLLAVPNININAQEDRGWTALMAAGINNWSDAVPKLLLDAGADPNIKDNTGKTVLDIAKPEFKRIFIALINESKINKTKLISGLSIELYSLSKA